MAAAPAREAGRDALALTDGQQAIDAANAHIKRARYAATLERVGALACKRPGKAPGDWSAPIERIAMRIHDPAEQARSADSKSAVAIRQNAASGHEWHVTIKWQDDAAVSPKANDFATNGRMG